MKRKDLSQAHKDALSAMVAALFSGAVLEFKHDASHSQHLCYCMRGEEMPDVPSLETEYIFEATQSGLFITDYSFQAGMERANRDQPWLHIGSLDEIVETIQSIGDAKKCLDSFATNYANISATNVPLHSCIIDIDVFGCDEIQEKVAAKASKQLSATVYPTRQRG